MKNMILSVFVILMITLVAGSANADNTQLYFVHGVVYEAPTESFNVETSASANPLQKLAAQFPVGSFEAMLEKNDKMKIVDEFSIPTSLEEPFAALNRRVFPLVNKANNLDISQWIGTSFNGELDSADGEIFSLDYSFMRHDLDGEFKSDSPVKILKNVSTSNVSLKTDVVRIVNGFALKNGKTRYLALFVNQ